MSLYAKTIYESLLIFIAISMTITFPFIIHEYKKNGFINFKRAFIFFSFTYYILTAFLLTVLPLPKMEICTRFNYNPLDYMQLVPFKFIENITNNIYKLTLKNFMFNPAIFVNVFNIMLLMPIGIYFKNLGKSLKFTIFFTFLISLFFEIGQLTGLFFIYCKPFRVFDVDDLILNTFGGMLGYLIGNIFSFIKINEEKFMIKKNRIIDNNAKVFPQILCIIIDIIIYTVIVQILLFIELLIFVLILNNKAYMETNLNMIYIINNVTTFTILFIIIPLFKKYSSTLGVSFMSYVLVTDTHKILVLIRNIVVYLPLIILPNQYRIYIYLYLVILVLIRSESTIIDKIFRIKYRKRIKK